MHRINKINFYYFSGTGNTEKIVKAMAEEFSSNAVEVNLQLIKETKPESVELSGLLGLGFPVAVFSTYPLVWEFIKALPPGKGCSVFVLDTLGGFSGGMIAPLKRILKQKGYNPIAALEIQMPPNIFYILSEEKNKKIIQLGITKAKEYAQDILNARATWPTSPLLSGLIYLFSITLLNLMKVKWGQQFFRYKVDRSLCTRCGVCIKKCPVNNISAEPSGYPAWDLHCQYCMRCISYCPTQAIPAIFNYKKRPYSPNVVES